MGSGSSRRRGAAAAAAAAAVPAGTAAAAETRELLETVLAECEEAAALPGPGRRAPAGGRCGEVAAGGGGGGGAPARAGARSPPGTATCSCHLCPQRNSKKPLGKSTISYDYSEEELMASIEREYCR
ncbi:unnamed protein product [Bubo scandiacus]